METKVFESPEGNVWKYVFKFDKAVAEAVLYKYNSFNERTVICCSVQSGCPVACRHCGAGKKFLRNLEWNEIADQVDYILYNQQIKAYECERLQIMFMSMGEPFLNYYEVVQAIEYFSRIYPNAELLVSTIAPNKPKELQHFIGLSKDIEKVGLQFSVHESFEDDRNELIPYRNKLSLREIRNYGIDWWAATGRKPFCNYCVTGDNNSFWNADALQDLFPPNVFNFTFSVVCSANETMKEAGFRDLDAIREFEKLFSEAGYNTRIFDPDAQDSIGSGCGQLWYVQRMLNGGTWE